MLKCFFCVHNHQHSSFFVFVCIIFGTFNLCLWIRYVYGTFCITHVKGLNYVYVQDFKRFITMHSRSGLINISNSCSPTLVFIVFGVYVSNDGCQYNLKVSLQCIIDHAYLINNFNSCMLMAFIVFGVFVSNDGCQYN